MHGSPGDPQTQDAGRFLEHVIDTDPLLAQMIAKALLVHIGAVPHMGDESRWRGTRSLCTGLDSIRGDGFTQVARLRGTAL